MSDAALPTIPEEFLDPEGTGEEQDPDLSVEETELEASSTTLRKLWAQWMCRKGSGRYADVEFFGKKIGGVPEPAVDAYRALEMALVATGYQPKSRWAYNCRKIANTSSYSLHSAGIAIDIDPKENPYTSGDKYAGKLKPNHVSAVLGIKNQFGDSVWSWGGNWKKPDRMHFQLDQGPLRVDVDWKTVPGEPPAGEISEEGNVLGDGSEGKAVVEFQNRILAWDPDALPKWGADGDYGNETITAVKRFQEEQGLEPTGNIDGVTAALLPPRAAAG
jgi:hypothetical protein